MWMMNNKVHNGCVKDCQKKWNLGLIGMEWIYFMCEKTWRFYVCLCMHVCLCVCSCVCVLGEYGGCHLYNPCWNLNVIITVLSSEIFNMWQGPKAFAFMSQVGCECCPKCVLEHLVHSRWELLTELSVLPSPAAVQSQRNIQRPTLIINLLAY